MAEAESEIERDWVPAIQARALVQQLLQENEAGAATALTQWAATKAVTSRFRSLREWSDEDPDDRFKSENGIVDDEFWHRFVEAGQADGAQWKTGNFSIEWYESGYDHHKAIYSVDFDANEIRQAAPPLPPAPQHAEVSGAGAISARPKGGAPRKPFWDPLWIEMIRRIRAGTLNPKSSGELERIMEDWCDSRGFTPGDGTLHRTALNLFKYLSE